MIRELLARRGWGALVIGLVAALQLTDAFLAEEAPEDEAGNPRVVSPAECQVEPRAVTELAQILHLDADGVLAPPYSKITAPLGEFADLATKVSINEATRELLACIDPLLPPPGPETLLVYFAHQDGRWLLDDWVDFTIVPAASSAATLAP